MIGFAGFEKSVIGELKQRTGRSSDLKPFRNSRLFELLVQGLKFVVNKIFFFIRLDV